MADYFTMSDLNVTWNTQPKSREMNNKDSAKKSSAIPVLEPGYPRPLKTKLLQFPRVEYPALLPM